MHYQTEMQALQTKSVKDLFSSLVQPAIFVGGKKMIVLGLLY